MRGQNQILDKVEGPKVDLTLFRTHELTRFPSWSNIGFEPIDENNEKHSILYACNECGTIKRESGNHTNDLQIEYAYLDDMDTHTIIYTCEECDYSWIELEDHYNYYCEYIEVTYDDNEHSLWYECICGETCADVYEHSYHSYDEPGEEYTYISDGTENSTHHYAIVKCYDCDHTTVSNEKISCSFDIYDYSYIDENYHYEHRRCNACGNTQSIKCEHDFYDEDIVYCNCGGR